MDLTSDAGEFHKRLMQNLCPKCSQTLQVIEKTEENLIRRCPTCKLDIHDKMPGAEYPDDICD